MSACPTHTYTLFLPELGSHAHQPLACLLTIYTATPLATPGAALAALKAAVLCHRHTTTAAAHDRAAPQSPAWCTALKDSSLHRPGAALTPQPPQNNLAGTNCCRRTIKVSAADLLLTPKLCVAAAPGAGPPPFLALHHRCPTAAAHCAPAQNRQPPDPPPPPCDQAASAGEAGRGTAGPGAVVRARGLAAAPGAGASLRR